MNANSTSSVKWMITPQKPVTKSLREENSVFGYLKEKRIQQIIFILRLCADHFQQLQKNSYPLSVLSLFALFCGMLCALLTGICLHEAGIVVPRQAPQRTIFHREIRLWMSSVPGIQRLRLGEATVICCGFWINLVRRKAALASNNGTMNERDFVFSGCSSKRFSENYCFGWIVKGSRIVFVYCLGKTPILPFMLISLLQFTNGAVVVSDILIFIYLMAQSQ